MTPRRGQLPSGSGPPSRSTIVTAWPRRCSAAPRNSPVGPAPMIATRTTPRSRPGESSSMAHPVHCGSVAIRSAPTSAALGSVSECFLPGGDMVTDAATTPDEIDDLARRAQEGDRDAMESLLAAVRPRALNVCRGVLPYTPDAADACQDALIKVAEKIGTWNQRGRFTTWLHVVAVNSAR